MLQKTEEISIDESEIPTTAANNDQAIAGIAILGSNPLTVMGAPFSDPSWLIYACSPDNTPYGHNKNRRELPRVDQTFEVHDPIEDPSRPYAYLNHIADREILWMRDRRALASGKFPGARLYPEKELKGTLKIERLKINNGNGDTQEAIAEIPNNDGKFCAYMFTSSIAYMLAKAICDLEEMRANGRISDGITPSIGIWGVLQASDSEYSYQRPGIQYFLWEAKMRDIRIVANRESCLFDMPNWNW